MHACEERARIEAIDKLWEEPIAGLEIPYDFAIYKEQLVVRGPVRLDHVRGEGRKLNIIVVEVARFHNDVKISTNT